MYLATHNTQDTSSFLAIQNRALDPARLLGVFEKTHTQPPTNVKNDKSCVHFYPIQLKQESFDVIIWNGVYSCA